MKLKVLSYNIHKGFSFGSKRDILEIIRHSIRALNPDVIFLQEVLGEHATNSIRIPDWNTQFEFLADLHWPHHAYGKNAVYSEGHHGNAILSRYPIVDWDNLTISENRPEPRGLLRARLKFDNGSDLLLANTHLDLTQKGRNAQTTMLIEAMRSEASPWILVGDFNDWNKKISPRIESELGAKEIFKEMYGRYPATFPALVPFLGLDRIFYSKAKGLSAFFPPESIWRDLSDHLPLVAEFEI